MTKVDLDRQAWRTQKGKDFSLQSSISRNKNKSELFNLLRSSMQEKDTNFV